MFFRGTLYTFNHPHAAPPMLPLCSPMLPHDLLLCCHHALPHAPPWSPPMLPHTLTLCSPMIPHAIPYTPPCFPMSPYAPPPVPPWSPPMLSHNLPLYSPCSPSMFLPCYPHQVLEKVTGKALLSAPPTSAPFLLTHQNHIYILNLQSYLKPWNNYETGPLSHVNEHCQGWYYWDGGKTEPHGFFKLEFVTQHFIFVCSWE